MEPVVFKVGDTVVIKSSDPSLDNKLAWIRAIPHAEINPHPILVKMVDTKKKLWFNVNQLTHYEIPDNEKQSNIHLSGQYQPQQYKEEV